LTIGSERNRFPVAAKTALATAGRNGRRAGLTDTARLLRALNNRHRDLGHLCQMQHGIGIEIPKPQEENPKSYGNSSWPCFHPSMTQLSDDT
jgi:hypothetical protein